MSRHETDEGVATRRPLWSRRLSVYSPPAVLLLFIAVLLLSMEYRRDSTARAHATHDRLADLRQLRTRVVDAETGQRGFLITGDSVYLEPWARSTQDAQALLARLRTGYAGNNELLSQFGRLDSLVARRLQIMQAPIAARVSDGFEAARQRLVEGRGLQAMAELRAVISHIEGLEVAQLAAEESAQQRAELLLLAVVLIGGLVVMATSLLSHHEFSHYAGVLERANAEQHELNLKLQEQAVEMEMQTTELQTINEELASQQDQMEAMAAELETSNEELQNANIDLEERTLEAEAANRAKAQFLASMSHELRTPLNAIGGYVDLMELGVHGPVTEEQLRDLERIRHNNRHLLLLISDILNYAKVQSGRLQLRNSDVPVTELAAEANTVMRPLVDAKQIAFSCDVTDGVAVRGDADRIRQVILNLLTNAVKFTQHGGAVSIRFVPHERHVSIEVADNGPGIPTELHEAIFDPFMQARRGAGGALSEGVGLGLSISRELALAMGGTITVRSAPGEGAVFTLTLPRADVAVDAGMGELAVSS